jgi:hypothetical protein
MAKDAQVVIKIQVLKTSKVNIIGDTPLIMHRFSEKVKQKIAEGQSSKGKTQARKPRDPLAEAVHGLHLRSGDMHEEILERLRKSSINPYKDASKILKEYDIGFPASGLKKACGDVAVEIDKVTKAKTYRAFHIYGADGDNLIEIKYKKAFIREDPVRLAKGAADLRYRFYFQGWGCTVAIRHNDFMTIDQIIALIESAGFSCGLGDWRPQKSGNNGMFHVHTESKKTRRAKTA